MSHGVGADRKKAKSPTAIPAAIVLCIVAGSLFALGFAFWNGGDWFLPPQQRGPELPFQDLKLSPLILSRNLPILPQGNAPLMSGGRAAEVNAHHPPVPYLPYTQAPRPVPEVYDLSANFMTTLRAIAVAKLERGGMAVPEERTTDSETPGPQQRIGSSNGTLLLHVEAKPDKKEKGTVIFRVSWELRRNLYLTRASNQTTSHRMEGGVAGPFRVWEKHLESAIIYELEKMIAEQIISRYQASNRVGAKGK